MNALASDAENSSNDAQSIALLDQVLQQLKGGVAPFMDLLEVKPLIA